MDCFEDVIDKYWNSTMNELFPSKTKNKILVYFFGIIHIIGFIYLHLGIYTPHKYIHLYILFLVTVIVSYFVLNEKCFVNHLVYKLRNKKEDIKNIQAGSRNNNCVDSKMTHLKMSTIYSSISLFLLISIISLLDKQYHIVNIHKNIYNYLTNINPKIHYLPLVTIYSCIIIYVGMKLFK